MAVPEMHPVFFEGGPARTRGGRAAAKLRSALLTPGVPDVRSTLGSNGQIVIARGAKDPVFFEGGPARTRGGRAAAKLRSALLTPGVPDVRSTLGSNGQIVIARGAKDERLV